MNGLSSYFSFYFEALSDETVLQKIKKIGAPDADELSNKISAQIGHHFKTLQDELTKKDDKIIQLEKQVQDLSVRCDELEQYGRRNAIRITGIDENPQEDTDDIVVSLANDTMGIPLQLDEISRSHRVGPKIAGKVRPLLVKFTSYRSKKRLMTNKRKLKGNAPANISSEGRIYLNDDLTKIRANLLYQARSLKRANKIQDSWSYDGRILVKDNTNRITPILSVADLRNYL